MDFLFRDKILGVSGASSGPTHATVTVMTVDITGKRFQVEINTPNSSFDIVGYKCGHTMCILNAQPPFGANAQFYYKVDDISTVEVRLFLILFLV
jgi:hypothetical protein